MENMIVLVNFSSRLITSRSIVISSRLYDSILLVVVQYRNERPYKSLMLSKQPKGVNLIKWKLLILN